MAAARESARKARTETPAQARQRERLQAQVGARTAEIREERGWTQAALAERLHVTMRHVQSVELGHENLTLGSIARISKALGVEVQDLFESPRPRTPRPGRPRRNSLS